MQQGQDVHFAMTTRSYRCMSNGWPNITSAPGLNQKREGTELRVIT